MEDLTGKQLGQYQVVEPLGAGGMATVYKAYQASMERYVALKILPRHMAAEPDFVQRFKNESKVIASLEHPNILPVHDFGEAESYTYLVMRYVEGQTLSNILLGQPLPTSQIQHLISQIAAALDYAHSRGVIHRDVKPSNVLLDEHGNCLLSDFGLAKVLISSSQLTASGAFLGTPKYASPEQCLGSSDIDQRSDVYSLGVILYEMVTGRPPFDADTPMGVVIKHIHDPLPMPRTINPNLPEAVERVILKALSKEVEGRYLTAGELAQAFYAAVEQKQDAAVPSFVVPPPEQSQTPSVSVSEVPVKPTRKFPGWAWAVGCLGIMMLVIVCGIGSIWAVNSLGFLSTPTAQPVSVVLNEPLSESVEMAAPQEASLTPETESAAVSQEDAITPTPWPTASDTDIAPSPIPTDTDTPAPTTDPLECAEIGQTWVSPEDGMTLVCVPAGEYLMGATESGFEWVMNDCMSDGGSSEDCESWYGDERPLHTVYIDAFWIDKTEITNDMYAEFVNATGYLTDAEKRGESHAFVPAERQMEKVEGADWQHPLGPSSHLQGKGAHPVGHMSWNDAVAYCTWAGRRLPTEAEWEKAAKGTDGRMFPWGNADAEGHLLNLADQNLDFHRSDGSINDGYTYTAPVGSYPEGISPYGVLDMAGNIWEWIADWYREEYYANSPYDNPTGPTSGDNKRLQRGGGWNSFARQSRTTFRQWNYPDDSWGNDGFRCVLDTSPSSNP